MKVNKLLLAVYFWLVIVVSMSALIVVYMLLWVISRPFDRKQYFIQKITQFWANFYIYIFPFWSVSAIGTEKLFRNRACIAVSNHQSMGDIIFLFNAYAYFIWVSKIENFQVPILGWVMTLNKYIRLKRKDPRTFPKMFEDIKNALADKRTIMMFPEGTRSKTSMPGRFKEGAFKAAIDNKVSIVPIVLDGAEKVMKKDAEGKIHKVQVTIKVLDEIPYESFPSYDPAVLKEYVREIIVNELVSLRQQKA